MVDNHQDLSSVILDRIESALNDSEFAIRDTAANIFINYWSQQLTKSEKNTIRLLTGRMENFMSIIFRQSFNLKVQLSGLDLLRKLVNQQYNLSESLLTLIECCLYDREKSISTATIAILESYAQRNSLPKTTIICLEHLLTTETPILANVILLLKKIVCNGHILSKKAIDVLGQLLCKTEHPMSITTLLTLADRNQPLPKNIDELLRQIYYAQTLHYSNSPVILAHVTKEILHLTGQGKLLTQWTLNLLVSLLDSIDRRESLIPILVNVVSNGQYLNSDQHRFVLEKMFVEAADEPSASLMEIFTQLSRQNQAIPSIVISKSQAFLINPLINHFIVEIYQHIVERQKPLDLSIIRKVFELFDPNQWSKMNGKLQNRLVLFCKAMADNRAKDIDQTRLLFLLTSQHPTNIRKEICSVIKTLSEHHHQLHPDTSNILLDLLNNDDDTDIQDLALQTLDHARRNDPDMNIDVIKFLDLLHCKNTTDHKYLLKQLYAVVQAGLKLPNNHLIDLSHMLYSL